METAKRRTKARQGYDLIREVACKIETFLPSQMLRIARAINPKLEEFQAHYEVMDDLEWLDDPRLSGSLRCLWTGSSPWDFEARCAFVFFREQVLETGSKITAHDVRLVYRFPGGEKRGAVWLDATTGRPWMPKSCLSFLPGADRINSEHGEDMRLASLEITKIRDEENTSFGWEWGANHNYAEEREIEVLQLCRRANAKADWKVIQTFATRYHPAGSMLPKPEAEEYRLKFLARQRELAEEVAA